ncbi:MAG TPA: hypothetical protein VFS43_27870 [Polyangiaceae bacterium]|nr:hypothetical protein [Polyangiaceae bacterium]
MTPPGRPKAAPSPPPKAPAPAPKGRARPPRAGGRPRKAEPPRVPWNEVDRLLVFGESVPCADGAGQALRYPSYRELGERYGCASSVISDYSTKHNCMRRRAENEARTTAKADQKLVELRATALAYSKDNEVRIIDAYLAGFEKALAEGRVRFDNPSDFNTMVRLKEFVLGGADSRQEVTATLSLEALQARHRQMLRGAGASAAEQGLVEGRARPLLAEGHEVAGPGAGAEEAGGWAVAPEEQAEADGDGAGDPPPGPPPPAQKPSTGKPSARFPAPEPDGTWDGGGYAAARPPRRAPSWASTPLDPALTGYRPRRPEGAAVGPPRRGDGASPPEAPPEGAAEEPSARPSGGRHDG